MPARGSSESMFMRMAMMGNQKSYTVLVKSVEPRFREPFISSLVNLQISILFN